jgi:hypothetical protein
MMAYSAYNYKWNMQKRELKLHGKEKAACFKDATLQA